MWRFLTPLFLFTREDKNFENIKIIVDLLKMVC